MVVGPIDAVLEFAREDKAVVWVVFVAVWLTKRKRGTELVGVGSALDSDPSSSTK